jgi:hypothetical protein
MGPLLLPTSSSEDDKQQWMTIFLSVGRQMQGSLLQIPCIGEPRGQLWWQDNNDNRGERDKWDSTRNLATIAQNNQCVVGVQAEGNDIIMAWRQIPPCWRVQRGEKNSLLHSGMVPTILTTKDALVTPLHCLVVLVAPVPPPALCCSLRRH